MEYKDYLKTKDWKDKRLAKHNRKGGTKRRCAICGSTEQLDVHHLRYLNNLEEIEQKDLRVLCRRCHELTHKLFDEGKIVFKSTNHNSRFTIIKFAVKKKLGLINVNLFKR